MGLDGKTVAWSISIILTIVVLMNIYSSIVPEAQTAGTDIYERGTELTVHARCEEVGCFWNATRTTPDCSAISVRKNDTTQCAKTTLAIPMSSLFASDGVVFIIVMIALLISIIFMVMKKDFK